MNDTNGNTNGHTNGEDDSIQLPSDPPIEISRTCTIQLPLTRRGHGPALILLVPTNADLKQSRKTLDPPPLQKWAEEGYAVAQIELNDDEESLQEGLREAFYNLSHVRKSYNISFTQAMSEVIDRTEQIAAVVTYGSSTLQSSQPQLRHVSGAPTKSADNQHYKSKTFNYPDVGPFFTIPAHADYLSSPAGVSHTRTLQFLKPLTDGPWFDLEAIWDEHTKFEFGERAVEKTMATMVQEPYVNHIPTMTGGIGRDRLTNFYTHHFIFNNPDDTALELVSRTVGIDRVIDEFIFKFTHDRMIDWLAPGIPPTGQECAIPFTSVVNIRGDRLYHEHIGWDGATLLRQLGLMPEYLPFPYAVKGAEGKKHEYRIPTAGVETAKKLVDERSVESNGMFEFSIREVGN